MVPNKNLGNDKENKDNCNSKNKDDFVALPLVKPIKYMRLTQLQAPIPKEKTKSTSKTVKRLAPRNKKDELGKPKVRTNTKKESTSIGQNKITLYFSNLTTESEIFNHHTLILQRNRNKTPGTKDVGRNLPPRSSERDAESDNIEVQRSLVVNQLTI